MMKDLKSPQPQFVARPPGFPLQQLPAAPTNADPGPKLHPTTIDTKIIIITNLIIKNNKSDSEQEQQQQHNDDDDSYKRN